MPDNAEKIETLQAIAEKLTLFTSIADESAEYLIAAKLSEAVDCIKARILEIRR